MSGDLLAGLNIGAVGSTVVRNGTAVGLMPSSQWFGLTDLFAGLQPDNPTFYNQWAAALGPISDAYNFAYSDRFAPVTVPLDPSRVDTLEVDIGGPTASPEPSAAVLLLAAVAPALAGRRRRTSRSGTARLGWPAPPRRPRRPLPGAITMSLKSVLGLEPSKKVRYGIVALGDIAQESLMPGVAHTGNSVMTALVSGDATKAAEVAKRWDVPADAVYTYDQFPALLASGKVDAVYIATPNWRHAEFAVPALRAGVHVLLEKPMEVTVAKCQQILDAQASKPGVKLMVAYRLHFEPATLAVIDLLRSGKVGHRAVVHVGVRPEREPGQPPGPARAGGRAGVRHGAVPDQRRAEPVRGRADRGVRHRRPEPPTAS